MLDIITVVYQVELPLLEIQARSIDLYIKPQDVNQIIIVVNDNDYVADLINPEWWGQHATKVIIKTTSEYDLLGTGWENQQLLKLDAVSTSTQEWAMILDAKTWFIKELDQDQLFGNNKKPWSGSVPGRPNVFVQARAFVEKHYNISLPKIIGPNGVPFLFHTNTVKEMIAEFDNFAEFFTANVRGPNYVTEFFMYSGYVVKKYGSLEELYNTNHSYLFPVNIAANETDQFDAIFSQFRRFPKAILTASIHQHAYPLLSTQQLDSWAEFLVEKQLFTDTFNAHNMINTYIK